jgi:hypothetical protein
MAVRSRHLHYHGAGMNHWTKEEIRLTRHAWYLHDMDRHDKFQRVSWCVSICVVSFVAIITLWR